MLKRVDRLRECVGRLRRHGAVLVLTAVLLIVVLGFVAFTVDVGYMALTKSQLQNAADAAAMATTWELLDERRLQLGTTESDLRKAVVAEAEKILALHVAGGKTLQATANNVAFGRMMKDRQFVEGGNWEEWDSVRVRIGRTSTDNGSLNLLFAPVLGSKTADVTSVAIATSHGGISGYRPTTLTGPCSLLPFTIDQSVWKAVLNGSGEDVWRYDSNSKSVGSGSDSIFEIKLFPNSTGGAGTFGALRVGDSSESGNAAIIRQTTAGGLTTADLQPYGGAIQLQSASGPLTLAGDTGTTTNIIRAASGLVGRPVSFFLHSKAQGSGLNTTFTICGFAGARIMHVVDSGSDRGITVQPGVVIDRTAIAGNLKSSWNVYQPVKLTN